MNSKTLSLLKQCLSSGDAQAWLAARPEHREALLPYLETDGLLRSQAGATPEPTVARMQAGQGRLLAAVAGMGAGRGAPGWASGPARAAAVLGVALAALGLAAGASALSGHNFADDVLSGLGVSEKADNGINNASPNAEHGRECASPNAFEGRGNAEDRSANADDAQAKEQAGCSQSEHAAGNPNPNAAEKGDNADDGNGNANENADHAGDHPNDHASQGSGNGGGQPEHTPSPSGGPHTD
ncbi:MAG TPA: hypothetical protein VFT91_05290 [Dehalococcoidia bacterium]|nr:hypothetical protein [Dehalococcoidia bacterium]